MKSWQFLFTAKKRWSTDFEHCLKQARARHIFDVIVQQQHLDQLVIYPKGAVKTHTNQYKMQNLLENNIYSEAILIKTKNFEK